MPAPHASQTQNQIASMRMREHDAIELPSAPFDAISPMQSVSGYLPTVGAIVIGAVIAFGVVASGVSTPVLVGMLGVLATVGLFFLFAYSAGYVRIGQRQPLADVVKAAADGLDVGVLIASRDGEVDVRQHGLRAYGRRRRCRSARRPATVSFRRCGVEFGTVPSDARRRARRDAGRGIRGRAPAARRAHAAHAAAGGQAVRRPRARAASKVSCCGASPTSPPIAVARRCASPASKCSSRQFDGAPIGLASVAADGTLLHVNGTLARWIGRTPKAVIDQHLKLADIASGEGAGLVSRLTGNAGDQVGHPRRRPDARGRPRAAGAPAGAGRAERQGPYARRRRSRRRRRRRLRER